MKSFSELPLSAQLKSNLARHGFTQLTAVQEQTIEPALSGRDLVATAQTGTGKTLAFVLPLINLLGNEPAATGIRALVLSPTRELAIQIHETFAKMAAGTGLRAAVVVGGLNEKTQLQAIRKGAQVMIATPGRLCDFLSRQLINLGTVRMLVLDEADRMLDMGFLPTIKRIIATTPADRQTLFFSATIETSVKHLIDVHVPKALRIEVGCISKPVEQVDLFVYEVDTDRKLGLLELMLKEQLGQYLVFARTKHGADRLAKKLARDGFKAIAIHGDRSQNQRNQALKGFQDGYYRVLVATDVAARGIHVEGISHVVNHDMPQVPEDFIHRVGRTGRAGARGTATTFAMKAERMDLTKIERTLGVKLKRLEVPASVQREIKSTAAPVIVMHPAPQGERRWQKFAPKRTARRAV
jgi:ATP-dependent RNA helicase RhlE